MVNVAPHDLASPIQSRQLLKAGLYTLPALIAGILSFYVPDLYSMLFTGGVRVLISNLSYVVLLPYMVLFILALGTIYLPIKRDNDDSFITNVDRELIRFFCGASLLILGGAILGFAHLLSPFVTLPIFCGVLFLYFLSKPTAPGKLIQWLLGKDPLTLTRLKDFPWLWRLLVALRFLLVFLMFALLVIKGLVPDIYSDSMLQQYVGYFTEIRYQQSTWMALDHPVLVDWFSGRGVGVHLFFTSFASQYIIMVIGVMYLFSIAVIAERVLYLFIPKNFNSLMWRLAHCFLPIACLMLILTSSMVSRVEAGKYHYQTGAFLFFLSWCSLLFLFSRGEDNRWLWRALLPVVIALPVLQPQYEAFAIVSLACAGVIVWRMRGRTLAATHLKLIVIGVVVTVAALIFNWLYTGIPESNPYYLFIAFANPSRLQVWSSPEQITYLNIASTQWDQKFGLQNVNLPNALVRGSNVFVAFSPFVNALAFLMPCIVLIWLVYIWKKKNDFSRLRVSMLITFILYLIGYVGLGLLSHRDFSYTFFDGHQTLLTLTPQATQLTPFELFTSYITLLNVPVILFTALAVLYIVLLTFVRRLRLPQSFDKRLIAVGGAFLFYYFVTWAFIQTLNHPSVSQELDYQQSVTVLAFLIIVMFSMQAFRSFISVLRNERLLRSKWKTREWITLIVLVLSLVVYIVPLAVYVYQLPPAATIYTVIIAAIGCILVGLKLRKWLLVLALGLNKFVSWRVTFTTTLIAILAITLLGTSVSRFIDFDTGTYQSKITRAAAFFVGRQGVGTADITDIVEPVIPWVNVRRCLELTEAVPGDAPVMLLNAWSKMFLCNYSPLLPRNKSVHFYQNVLSPNFKTMVYGTKEEQIKIYKEQGINYFYVKKGDDSFYGPAFSDTFSVDNLSNDFDVVWENDEAYVMTWRGNGVRPVTHAEAVQLDLWRQASFIDPDYFHNAGAVAYVRLKQLLEGKKG